MQHIWLDWAQGCGTWPALLRAVKLMELTELLLSNRDVVLLLAGKCACAGFMQPTAGEGPEIWQSSTGGVALLEDLAAQSKCS